jgi:hypothetical protein
MQIELEKPNLQELETRLRERISAHDWGRMPELLNISPTKWTRMLTGTDEWPARCVFELADLAKLHWYHDMVRPFGVGATTITLDHAEQAANAEGSCFDLVDRAA